VAVYKGQGQGFKRSKTAKKGIAQALKNKKTEVF